MPFFFSVETKMVCYEETFPSRGWVNLKVSFSFFKVTTYQDNAINWGKNLRSDLDVGECRKTENKPRCVGSVYTAFMLLDSSLLEREVLLTFLAFRRNHYINY